MHAPAQEALAIYKIGPSCATGRFYGPKMHVQLRPKIHSHYIVCHCALAQKMLPPSTHLQMYQSLYVSQISLREVCMYRLYRVYTVHSVEIKYP